MAQNNASAPVVQVIDYPNTTPGRDLPTAGLPSPLPYPRGTRDRLYGLLQQPTMVNGHLGLEPLPYSNMTCFRDTALTVLFSLKPFMNFLNNVSPPGQGVRQNAELPSNMVRSLANLGRAFWTRPGPQFNRFAQMDTEMDAFWSEFINLGYLEVNDGRQVRPEDTIRFMSLLLDELITPGNHIQQRDITILSQMMLIDLNQRFVSSCNCPQKERQGVTQANRFWVFSALWDTSIPTSNFSDALSSALYMFIPNRASPCPFCGTAAGDSHKYGKFRTMPEILLVGPVPSLGGLGYDRNVRFPLPEILDLTPSQDKPIGSQRAPVNPGGEEDDEDPRALRYHLQSLVSFNERGIHYRSHMRRGNGLWDRLDGNLEPDVVRQSSLSDIESDRNYQPYLLAYVREEQLEVIAAALGQTTRNAPGTNNDDTIQQGPSQSQPLPGSTQNTAASGNGQNQPATANGQGTPSVPSTSNDSDAAIDTSTWTVLDFQRELKNRGIGINGKKNVDSYRSIWQAYVNNPRDYNLYTVPGLRTLMSNRTMDIPKTMRLKADFIAALQAHDTNTANSQPLNPPRDPTQSPQQPQQTQQPHTTHQADDNLTAENTRLTAENQALHAQLDALQRAHYQTAANLTASQQALTQATASLNTLQQTHDQTAAGFSVLQRLHTTMLADRNRLAAENQALRTQQGATGSGTVSSQVSATLAADNARLTAECQTLRASNLRVDGNIKNATSRPTMLLASVTVRGRTERFLIPLPLYHFTTWARPTSDTLIEDSGSVRVTVHLTRQDIDPTTSRIRDRDVVLRVDGQGVDNNGGDVTVELRLITIHGPLSLDQFRTHTQGVSNDTGSSDRNNSFRPFRSPEGDHGRSLSNEQREGRHSQPVRDDPSGLAQGQDNSHNILHGAEQHQGRSRGPSSRPSSRPEQKRPLEQAEEEQSIQSKRRRTNSPEHDNSSTRRDPHRQSSPPSQPNSAPLSPSRLGGGLEFQSLQDPRAGDKGANDTSPENRNKIRQRNDNASPDNHNLSGQQANDPHDMAGDPLFANFLH